MIEKITGIVLDVVRHSDRYNIVTLFTRERGRVAFLSAAGNGKAARMRNARLMPLGIVSADVNFKGNRELQNLGSIIPAVVWHDLYCNPVKSAIVLFLSEVLNAFLRQADADVPMWNFIVQSLHSLDRTREKVANRHLAFLIGMLPHAGIEPILTTPANGDLWFDMRDGRLTPSMPLHNDYVRPDEARFLPLLIRMTADNCGRFRFSASQRRRLLNGLVRYYSVHYPGMENLKSLSVLNDTFQ